MHNVKYFYKITTNFFDKKRPAIAKHFILCKYNLILLQFQKMISDKHNLPHSHQ